jgi:3-deoxy-D-manno-octulosonic-acid transferase
VSVGEVMAAVPLVRAMRERWPAMEIVLSTVTATGQRVARERLPEVATVFTCPVDLGWVMRRALRRISPRAFIALETELWPNLLRSLHDAGIPGALVNGRISDRSFTRYRRVRPLFRRVLEHLALFAMQSEEDARRIVALGAPTERVIVTGNLKLEMPVPAGDAGRAWREILGIATCPVWVAGSTHPGEEALVLDAFVRLRINGPLHLVLAPRHPERVSEVETAIRERGLGWRRRSAAPGAGGAEVTVLDTVGELASLYAAADVVFVGGSLVARGGHNVMEPAIHGKAVVFGPHMANFRDAAALLLEHGAAVQLQSAEELRAVVGALLEDPERRRVMGDRARAVVAAHRGPCARTLEALERLLAV